MTSPEDLGRTGPAVAESPARAGHYSSGQLIAGKYQLGQILGEGGMGAVWQAHNRTLDLEVALKLMRSELAGDIDGIAERMLQEARAAASIGHPAIIQVQDFGFTERGEPYIAMELLRGESLSQAIKRRGRINPARAAQTLLPIVDALAAAHRAGIVHRDLKPENIFLSRPAGHRLQPKVLDFGIAKLEQRAQERLTRDGAIMGSPAYMSPEQLRGDPEVDARADVWSLGVVFYQMITGQRPFEGANYHASMSNILNAEPRALADHGVVDAELWRIIEKCLEKEPRARYADMRAYGRDLARWLVSQGVAEDVGNASLAPWLDDTPQTGGAVLSFFPADAPPLPRAEQGPPVRRIAVEGAPGPLAVRRAARLERARFNRNYLIVPIAAVCAFAGAALLTNWRADDEREPAVRRRSAHASLPPVAPKPPEDVPGQPQGVLSPLASTLVQEPADSASGKRAIVRAPLKRPPKKSDSAPPRD